MSEKDERETPDDLFAELHAEFSFTLDAAASHVNHKLPRYCTKAGGQIGNGLTVSWSHERVFCNPPFSDLDPWLEKAWTDEPDVACILLPANRTEQPLWQLYVEPYRDRAGSPLSTRFLPGRRHFTVDGGQPILQPPKVSKRTGKPLKRTRSSAEFGLVICIWDRRVPGGITRTPRV